MAGEPSDTEIADDLLQYLRGELGSADLAYVTAPVRLSGGNETLIFAFALDRAPEAFSGPLILRAFRAGYVRPDQARWEATVQNAVAAQGYPAPRALLTCPSRAVLGTPFLIMEHLPGTMLLQGTGELDAAGQMRFQRHQTILRARLLLRDLPRICAEAQIRLHTLDPEPLLEAFQREGLPLTSVTFDGRLEALRNRIDGDELGGLREAFSWVIDRQPQNERLAICHGDIQPNNILLTGRAITGVVDWSQAVVAGPAYDVGFTKMAFDTVPLRVPGFLGWAARPAVRRMGSRYMASYRRHLPIDLDAVRYYGVFRGIFVLAFIGGRRLAGTREPDVWDSPDGIAALISYVRSATGTAISLPPETRPAFAT